MAQTPYVSFHHDRVFLVRNKFFQNEGQTLIEVMITVAFIAISAIALVRFQNDLAYDNSYAQQKSEAIILATKQMETLRDYQVLNNTSGYTSYQSIASGSSTVTGVNASYSLSWTVTPYINPTYKTLDVTVSWTDRYNNTQSVELTSTVAGLDPTNSSDVMG